MHPKSRWRFSLRGLLVFVLLFGVWLACGVNRLNREKAAMTEIVKQGGRAGYCFSLFYPFRCIYVVAFTTRDFGNEELRETVSHLQRLPGLSHLQLMQTTVTDEGLVHIGKLRRLNRLDLFDNAISDEGINHLVGLQDLRELDLSATLVSDKGVMQLQTLESLQKLSVSDATLPRIAGQPPESPEERRLREQAIADLQPAGVVSRAAIAKLQQELPRCSIQAKGHRYSGLEDSQYDVGQLPVPSEILNGNFGY